MATITPDMIVELQLAHWETNNLTLNLIRNERRDIEDDQFDYSGSPLVSSTNAQDLMKAIEHDQKVISSALHRSGALKHSPAIMSEISLQPDSPLPKNSSNSHLNIVKKLNPSQSDLNKLQEKNISILSDTAPQSAISSLSQRVHAGKSNIKRIPSKPLAAAFSISFIYIFILWFFLISSEDFPPMVMRT